MELEQVATDLESQDFEVWTLEIPACAIGQDHRRFRYWLLGYSDSNCKSSKPLDAKTPRVQRNRSLSSRVDTKDGFSRGLAGTERDRLKMLGNAVVPQIPEMIGKAIMESQKLKIWSDL